MKWYLKVLRQYADFEGRASVREYWMFVLFNILVSLALAIVIGLVYGIMGVMPNLMFYYLYLFALLLPGMAVAVRRLHDTDRSGWFLLIGLIPLIGGIWLLVLMLIDGTPDKNRYGDNPKKLPDNAAFDKTKSTAKALIIASFVWIFAQIAFIGVSVLGEQSRFILSMGYFFYFTYSIGLLFIGFSLLKNRKLTSASAWVLIAFSCVWIINYILTIINLLDFLTHFSGWHIFTNLSDVVIPIAFLLLGIAILQNRENKSDIKIAIQVAAWVWVLIIAINVAYSMFDLKDFTSVFLAVRTVWFIIVPMSLLCLASWLTSEEAVQSVKAGIASPSPMSSGTSQYYERDNKGMRVDTFSQSMSYWLVERFKSSKNDPFVYYVFDSEKEAKAAMLELPFIHQAADTGKLICDDVFRFGYFAITNDGQLTGEYDAFIAGADFTHDMWEKAHVAFAKHNGVKKNEQEPEKDSKVQPSANGNAAKVTFIRESRDNNSVWRVHQALSKADALAFLSQHPIDRPLYYMIVETPEGNFGRDIDGFYQE